MHISCSSSLRRYAVLAATTAGLGLLAACSSSGGASSSSTTGQAGSSSSSGTGFRVALYDTFPPDIYVDNGQIIGWVPDLLTALEKPTGLTFQTVGVTQFDSVIPGLQSGRYDMAPNLYYITPARLQVVDMVTVSQVGTSFGANPSSPVSVTTETDICGHKIATLSGSAYITQIEAMNKACTAAGKHTAVVQVYPNDSAAVLSVTDGRNDLYAGTTDEVGYLQKQNKLTVEPYVYGKQAEAIAFPKGSQYETKIQTAINSLIESGEYQAILDKWHLGSMAITSSTISR